MRLKVIISNKFSHSDVASCVGWANTAELYSVGDDQVILKQDVRTDDCTKVAKLPKDIYSTDIDWYPEGVSGKKQSTQSELFALACTDGRFLLVSKSGRVEKTVEGHKGAVLGVKWMSDGTALLTYGEDGAIKVWSRSGMLRSVLAQNALPVYSASWSPEDDQVLYTMGKSLVIKPLQPTHKVTQWKAHDGIIMATDWGTNNNIIISGGEDRKYKIWDSYGRSLYTSLIHDCPVVSLSWAPDGDMFVVGGFNTLRLCDKAGWSCSLDKPQCGTILKLSWSSDSTQVGGASGSGQVILAQVIEKRMEWKHLHATVISSTAINVRNVLNNSQELLEFSERIVKTSLDRDHLIVTTPSQCFIYRERNWTTPVTFDLRSSTVFLIKQAEKFFLMAEKRTGIQIISYEGRVINTIKYTGLQPADVNTQTVAISNDTIVIRDKRDSKVLHFFDSASGKELSETPSYSHKTDITTISLNQTGPQQDRQLAIIDKNNDLHILPARDRSPSTKPVMLGSMVTSSCWNDQCNMLGAMQDNKLVVWYHPAIAYTDRDLLSTTSVDQHNSGFTKNPQIIAFNGSNCTLRRADGAVIMTRVSPFPFALHNHVSNNHWTAALKLCRMAKDLPLWACLAGMAAAARELSTAITAYSAINEVDKVHYLTAIQASSNAERRNADLALFCHQPHVAESAYLQSGQIYKAIELNMHLFNWDRALELSIQHKTHVDTVLAFRQKYLQDIESEETIKKFKQYSDKITIDWEKVNAKVAAEEEKQMLQ